MTTATQTATCPECFGDVPFDQDVLLHEIVQCPDCGVELDVVGVDPVELDLAPEVEEDWGE